MAPTAVVGTTGYLTPGEPIYYVVQYNSADGSTIAVLGGRTEQRILLTKYRGRIESLTINNSITASCTVVAHDVPANLN